jgi:hypothetical protein
MTRWDASEGSPPWDRGAVTFVDVLQVKDEIEFGGVEAKLIECPLHLLRCGR